MECTFRVLRLGRSTRSNAPHSGARNIALRGGSSDFRSFGCSTCCSYRCIIKHTMKSIVLQVGVGVSCFLAGVIACYAWLHSQQPKPSAGDAESSLVETPPPAGDGAVAGGNANARTAKFAALDTDQDGRLSLSEFSVGRGTTEATKWFGRRDADRDGFLSRQEFLPFSASKEAQ